MATRQAPGQDTKGRILDAAEALYVERGHDAMSLRQITARADVNLAAANYHFGSKDVLLQAMLSRRLDPLNERRLTLLTQCQAAWPAGQLTCEHVLGALFIPALHLSRDPQAGGPAFLRLLGRVYTDAAPFVRRYLEQCYTPVFERFFEAFAQALPELARPELDWRLHFALQALSGVLASHDSVRLIDTFSQGRPLDDMQLIVRLSSLMIAALRAPTPGLREIDNFGAVFALASTSAATSPPAAPEPRASSAAMTI